MKVFKALKKKHHKDHRTTLISLHEQKQLEFEKYYATLPKKKKTLLKITKRMEEIEKEKKCDLCSTEYHNLKTQNINLLEEIQNIENKTDYINYMCKVAPLLKEYVSLKNTNKELVEWSGPLSLFVEKSEGNDKGTVLEKYFKVLGQLPSTAFKKRQTAAKYPVCPQCKIKLFIDSATASAFCKTCGHCISWQDEELPQWSDDCEQVSVFAYKRINHFSEWLSQLQAKESTIIPKEVTHALLKELKKFRITDTRLITHTRIKTFLKKLRLNKYYEHIPSIISLLSGKKAPQMTIELEQKLRSMFMKIQTPFEKYKPANRRNFLSYSFVLHKFCQLIGQEPGMEWVLEFTRWFPLLKSREKLYVQDKIWKGICTDLHWEFIPSI